VNWQDLALGVADLNTPEALAAAELAANGQVLKVDNSGECDDQGSDSDSDEEDDISGSKISQLLNGSPGEGRQKSNANDDSEKSQNKRKRIEML
jgi:hypothetical protein